MKNSFEKTMKLMQEQSPNFSANIPIGKFAETIMIQVYEKGKEFQQKNNVQVIGLNSLSYHADGSLSGSSTISLILLNQLLAPYGMRTIRHNEAESIRGLLVNYEVDTGIVLKNTLSMNSETDTAKKYLIKQLREQNPSIKFPVVINLDDLLLEPNYEKRIGVFFKLKKDAKPNYIASLDNIGDMRFLSKDIDISTGFPKRIYGKEDRHLNNDNTRKLFAGLSDLLSLKLSSGSTIDYSSSKFENSYDFGKIVIVNDKHTIERG